MFWALSLIRWAGCADGVLPAQAIRPSATAAKRLEPWPVPVEALTRLSADVTVIGLPTASRQVLTGLGGNSGMRWHQVLSAENLIDLHAKLHA